MKKEDRMELVLDLQEIRDLIESGLSDLNIEKEYAELEYKKTLRNTSKKKKKREKIRDNRYICKLKTKQKLKKLNDKHVYFISAKTTDNGESYLTQFYLSGCRKYAKRETNRKIRSSKNDFKLNGCAYRRKFDYWNTLF